MPNRVSRVTVRVACAQLAARERGGARAALDDILAAVAGAGELGCDIVVLPECSYPAYVLLERNPFKGRSIPSADAALRRVAAAARRARINVAVGIAKAGPDGRLRNAAVLIDRGGEVVGLYAKAHLWNFDSRWFAPGHAYPVFDLDIGRIGMMICADGRVPEIARTLVHRGAWLILDPTAWVGYGASYAAMPNPQVDFALRVRAAENGVWIAAADKCGSETGVVHYVGRSMIVGPDGKVAAIAPAEMPALIVADLRRRGSTPFIASLTPVERRHLLAVPVKHRRRTGKSHAAPGPVRIGVYQSAAGAASGGRQRALRALRAQGVDAVIVTSATRAALDAALRRVRGLRATVVEGARMLAPEPARAAALAGADMLVWTDPPPRMPVLAFARTRAMENRTYVLLCARADDAQPACLIGPDGGIVASALAGTPSGFTGAIDVRAAREKSVVWGTDAFADRTPGEYELFV